MNCDNCSAFNFKTVETKGKKDSNFYSEEYKCNNCGHKWLIKIRKIIIKEKKNESAHR